MADRISLVNALSMGGKESTAEALLPNAGSNLVANAVIMEACICTTSSSEAPEALLLVLLEVANISRKHCAVNLSELVFEDKETSCKASLVFPPASLTWSRSETKPRLAS